MLHADPLSAGSVLVVPGVLADGWPTLAIPPVQARPRLHALFEGPNGHDLDGHVLQQGGASQRVHRGLGRHP